MGGGRTWRLDCKTRVDLTGVTREKLVMQTGRAYSILWHKSLFYCRFNGERLKAIFRKLYDHMLTWLLQN